MPAPTPSELAATELFEGLSESDLEIMAQWFEVDEAFTGQTLAMEGNAGYAFCVLHEGTADVLIDGSVVRTLSAGDYFGEISMLGEGRQTATITVTSPAVVWTMFGTRFRILQQEHPELAAVVAATASKRLGTA